MSYRFLLFLFFTFCLFAQESTVADLSKADKDFILKAFNHADGYMNSDHYDSAQLWLNKIYNKVSYRKPSLFSYFLTSRQAEVYYYNNLHELGLQEAFKAENIALVLKDSLLIADAYNFIGLFYMNNHKTTEAIKYFKKGLLFCKQPPYNIKYIELSKPHHIYGNLSEAFEKLNRLDSAIFYSRASLEKAKEIQSGRGTATANLNLGSAFIREKQIDSAKKYFELTNSASVKSNDFDVELNSYSGLADCASEIGDKSTAFNRLSVGFKLLKKYPQLNDFYSLMFLETALKVYRKYKNDAELIKTLELKTQIQTATYERNNTQIQTLLLTGLKNEKLIFNLELAESQHKQSLATTRTYILLLVLLVFVIAFIAYRYYSLQRLKLANVRMKISQDLHDEVGATLSGIAMYSYITQEQIKNRQHDEVTKSLDLIKDNAGEMASKLNDIVWAVNPMQDNLYELLERLKDFALQIAATKEIKVAFEIPEMLAESKLAMELRKNIYLICKEAINNAVKYSGCSLLKIDVNVIQRNLSISIGDDGKGFSLEKSNKGNGLINMESRAKEISAKLVIRSVEQEGTKIELICKIT
ncbi:histidine kinase [Pedobacter aquatilis]|uniref:tetratricopeptide repeat-containing sensor histidine kinase n=1 Tax=Pedobacter aquatilis TaxID=351343 RepID=UPI00292DE7B2|nr:histidine kinase [Pedobacter aquatilis]